MNPDDIVRAWQTHAAAQFSFVSFAGRRMKLGLSEVAALEVLQVRSRMTPGELGEALSMPSGSVTALLDRLLQKKMIIRTPSASDRRSATIALSPDAFEKASRDLVPMANEIKSIATDLSDAGKEAVQIFLNRVAAALLAARD